MRRGFHAPIGCLTQVPCGGDASTWGNVLGFTSMALWTGYVVSTRHVGGDMDVATFMATISPIAAVAVLPLAIANGDMFEMSARGWAYTLVLMLLTGVAAHGLLVFAQRTIQIGTIGIAQVAQPALAVVWSFLLLGETVRSKQVAGIAIVMGGLLGFLVLNERGGRARRARLPGEAVIATSETSGPAVLPADPPEHRVRRPSPRARRFGRGR